MTTKPHGRRTERAAATRERILVAAREVLAADGLERFTTRRVADLARISLGVRLIAHRLSDDSATVVHEGDRVVLSWDRDDAAVLGDA